MPERLVSLRSGETLLSVTQNTFTFRNRYSERKKMHAFDSAHIALPWRGVPIDFSWTAPQVSRSMGRSSSYLGLATGLIQDSTPDPVMDQAMAGYGTENALDFHLGDEGFAVVESMQQALQRPVRVRFLSIHGGPSSNPRYSLDGQPVWVAAIGGDRRKVPIGTVQEVVDAFLEAQGREFDLLYLDSCNYTNHDLEVSIDGVKVVYPYGFSGGQDNPRRTEIAGLVMVEKGKDSQILRERSPF